MLKKCIFTWENTKTAMEKKNKHRLWQQNSKLPERTNNPSYVTLEKKLFHQKNQNKSPEKASYGKEKKRREKGKINGKTRQQTKKRGEIWWIENLPESAFCDLTWPSKQDVANKKQTANKKDKQTSQGKIQDPANRLLLAWPYSNHLYYLSHPQTLSQAFCGHQHFALIFWSDRFAYCSKMAMCRISFFYLVSQSRMLVVAPQKKKANLFIDFFFSQFWAIRLPIWDVSIHEHASLRCSMGTASVCQRLEVL